MLLAVAAGFGLLFAARLRLDPVGPDLQRAVDGSARRGRAGSRGPRRLLPRRHARRGVPPGAPRAPAGLRELDLHRRRQHRGPRVRGHRHPDAARSSVARARDGRGAGRGDARERLGAPASSAVAPAAAARHPLALARSLLRVGLLFLVLQLAVAVAFTSNSIIIAAMLGPSAVADYAVVSKLFLIPAVLVSLALAPLWPAYREALSRGDVAWVRRTFGRSIRLSLSVAGLVSAVLVVFGIPIIAIWVGTSSVQPSFGLDPGGRRLDHAQRGRERRGHAAQRSPGHEVPGDHRRP